MAYVEVEEVRTVMVGRRVEERNETPGTELDDDQIEYAIDSADAQIDASIRKRYTLPLNPVPKLVKILSTDIASYLAHLIFLGTSPLASDAPAVLRYDRARRMLDEIKSGRMELDATEIANEESGLEAIFNEYDMALFGTRHIFGDQYPEGYIPPDYTHY